MYPARTDFSFLSQRGSAFRWADAVYWEVHIVAGIAPDVSPHLSCSDIILGLFMEPQRIFNSLDLLKISSMNSENVAHSVYPDQTLL